MRYGKLASFPSVKYFSLVCKYVVSLSPLLALQINTFQCVLAFHDPDLANSSSSAVQEAVSFVLFLYKDGAMQWSKPGGEVGRYAAVEISDGANRCVSGM